jgi:hypothetical protein
MSSSFEIELAIEQRNWAIVQYFSIALKKFFLIKKYEQQIPIKIVRKENLLDIVFNLKKIYSENSEWILKTLWIKWMFELS